MRVLISGGGTAGHINPAIAIGNCILKNDKHAEILYIGSLGNLEQGLYEKANAPFKLYESKGLSRKNIFENFSVMTTNIKAFRQIKKDVLAFKPDIGISTGGYISALAMQAVMKLKVPFIIHEQNAYPGLTTRYLSKYANKYALAFMKANDYLKYKDRAVLTGNPVRSEFFEVTKKQARQKLGFSPDEKIILCFGGSLGAQKLNEAFMQLVRRETAADKYRLIIGTGTRYYDQCMEELQEVNWQSKKISILKYITNMTDVLTACDLAITRSGAMTVSELAAIGKPSILIPSPNVTADHQTKNAEELVKAGGAFQISEKDLEANMLISKIDEIMENNALRSEMSRSLGKIAICDADLRVYKIIKGMVYCISERDM